MSSEIWYRKVGFYNNPFSIKPAAYHDSPLGLGNTIDDISYAILTKKLIFVEGEYGQGKTTILKKLINDFGGKKQVAYFSCNRLDGRLNIQKLLKKRYGFLGKLFSLEAKDMILLLDEAQYLGEEDYKKLAEHHRTGSFKSVVFVTPKINGSANGLLQNALVVNLKKLNQTEAVNIVRRRVGNLHLLSDNIINEVFERSNRNVRELLKNCEKVCKYAVDNELTKVSEEALNAVLNPEAKKAETKTEDATEEKKPTVKKQQPAPKKQVAKKKPLNEDNKPAKKEGLEELQEPEEAIAVSEEIKAVVEEEDEIDRQVKEMAMLPDDNDDLEETPKKRKKPAEALTKSEPEDLLNEEDYY